MVSSLAAQLAKNASLNSALLVDKSRRKPTQSYLFTPKEADQHDLDSIYALGVNGFTQLATLNGLLRAYDASLFSDAAKALDRTLQPSDVVADLDRALDSFLPLLGPYLLENPTGKVLEWLVRRFRVNEFNVSPVLALFLPYHESPHFAKMLSILHITEASPFAPLIPFKTTSTPLSRPALVKILLQPQNSDFARFVASILPAALQMEAIGGVHRGLIAFHTSVLLDFIKKNHDARKGNVPDESILAWYLPAASEPLQICSKVEVESSREALVKETILSAFLLLSALSHTCPLTAEALSSILKLATACASRVSPKHLTRTFIALCAVQDNVSDVVWSNTLTKSVLRIPDIEQELKEALPYAGSEKFIGGFLSELVPRLSDEQAFRVVDALVTHSELPAILIRSLTVSLFKALVEQSSTESHSKIRSLLVQVQQRHPDVLQNSYDDMLETDSDKKDVLEQALLSLSMDLPGTTKKLDSVVGSMNADSNVRIIAVRELYEKLKTGDSEEKASIQSALMIRIQDTSAPVLEALYANPAELLPIIFNDASAYIDTISHVLHSSPAPGRSIIKAHVTFVARHLYPALVERSDGTKLAGRLFYDVALPFLLYSKPRQKTASAIWEILEATEKVDDATFGLARYELLAGCVDAARWETSDDREGGNRSASSFIKVNLAVAGRIAENVVASDMFGDHITAFLSKLQDQDAHARALAYLVVRSLLSRLSGEHQLDAGLRAMTSMGLEGLDTMSDFLKGAENVQEVLDDTNLGYAVFHKPSSRNTLSRMQASILVMLPTISRPSGVSLNWLDDPKAMTDTRASKYMQLMRTVYKLANSTVLPPMLAGYLLRVVLINLGEDSLRFLASIWLSSDPKVNADPSHYVSLHHAAAFLEAHHATQRWIDFQTIIPAILAALQHIDRRVRGAALECVTILAKLSQAKKPMALYAYDAIYGSSSDALQYLDWADLSKYIQALGDAREHILNDASYLAIFHQHHLAAPKWEPKRESGRYKKRILCYIMSHVNACGLPSLKVSLLKSVAEVSSSVKSQMLMDTIQSVGPTTASAFGPLYEEFSVLLISVFDASAADSLNDTSGTAWITYQDTLRHFFQSGSVAAARRALANRIIHGLFAELTLQRKVELCQLLLELGQSDHDVSKDCRDILISVLTEVPVIVHVLRALQPDYADVEQRASKRAKVDGSEEGGSKGSLSSLNAFADILSASQLPGSVELLTVILETLTKLVHDVPAASGDKVFAEQLLLSALENSANHMHEDTRLPATAIRLDILVESIRASENPQTFNQALLLMATLARLAPDAVLLNIMPIFTFMGSNVFHRDDSYSFRVVQKTIGSIVPVMISSLRKSHPERFELHVASRAFLRIFTDAANHIPRHRRTGFFSQLVDALTPQDFLAPVSMLLVDKVANRVVRQNVADARNSLTLPLTVLQRYPLELQLSTLVEILREAHRLTKAAANPDGSVQTFLELPSDDEHTEPATTMQRQAQALLIFVGQAIRTVPSAPFTDDTPAHSYSADLLSLTLDLAVSKNVISSIADTARSAIKDILSSMTAIDFVLGVFTILQSGEPTVQQGALELLGDNLAELKDASRTRVSKTVIKIIEATRKVLLSDVDESLVIASFHGLKGVVITMCPGEESALTSLVPVVVTYIRDDKSVASALDIMSSLVVKLGPRIIPYFKDIVSVSVSVFHSEGLSVQALSTSLNILQALLHSIPKFWSKNELAQVLDVYLESSSSAARTHVPEMATLMKAVAKKAPAKVLLPLLCETWTSVASADKEVSEDQLLAYWSVLKRTIRAAPRPIISDHLRQLFKTFLDAFQFFASNPQLQENIEPAAISTFLELVVKINEATFKPLFRKLFDWAFTIDDSMANARKLVFCHIYSALLDYFKGLMTPYMSFLLQPTIGLLEAFRKQSKVSTVQPIWRAVVEMLTKTFIHDDSVFWRDDKLRQLLSPLVSQLAVSVRFNDADSKAAVSECLLGLAEVLSDDSLLKSLNLDILMNTRSEDSRLRLQALTCSEAIWRSHGGKLLGFVSETVTFIAEAAEDDNDDVVREALRLKDAVESVAGRIDV